MPLSTPSLIAQPRGWGDDGSCLDRPPEKRPPPTGTFGPDAKLRGPHHSRRSSRRPAVPLIWSFVTHPVPNNPNTPRPSSTALDWLRLARPADWIKNLLVFAALVFSGNLTNPRDIALSSITFAGFCLLASGFYCINDAIDAPRDRLHPLKRHRAVADGRISRISATLVGCLLATLGVLVCLYVTVPCGILAGAYAALQLLYNAKLKRVLTVDVVALTLGFVLRATAGAAAINVPVSIWLVLCVFFLCLFLGFAKRLADVVSATREGRGDWTHPAGYRDNIELHWLLGVSATMTLVSYVTYTLSPHATRLFAGRAIGLALLSPLLFIVMHRLYRQSALGLTDRPLDAISRDRAVLASLVLYAAGVVLTLYYPPLAGLLDRLFLH